MDIESIRLYALSKENAEETMPFGPEVVVFKVNNKIFLILSLDKIPTTFSVKCNPERAIELREQYSSVVPGFHLNKKHWNTITIDGSLNQHQLKEMIDHSYQLVAPNKKK